MAVDLLIQNGYLWLLYRFMLMTLKEAVDDGLFLFIDVQQLDYRKHSQQLVMYRKH